MVETILSSPLFVEVILPFLLVFTLVFAILQKSELLGAGKRQTDAIVALVVGLMVIAFGNAVGIITSLMPVLAVSIVVIVVFMILFGVVYKEGMFAIPRGIKIAWGIIAAIIVVVAVLAVSGVWNYLVDLFGGIGPELLTNVIFIVLIIAAIAVVVGFGGGKKPATKSAEG